MTTQERLETAPRSSAPGRTLRTLVQDLAREGIAKGQIYDLLEKLVLRLRTQPDYRETEEEAILDVMDALDGWCHPSAQLMPDERVP
jgi:hypothetical protein